MLDMISPTKIRNPRQIKKFLSESTWDLTKMYEQTLHRIASQDVFGAETARKALLWICYSQIPLHVNELQHAIATELEDMDFDPDGITAIELISSCCMGLLVCDDQQTCRLFHLTAYDFLRNTPEYGAPVGNLMISKTCLTYLSFSTIKHEGPCSDLQCLEQRLQNLCLINYAAKMLGEHAREVEDSIADAIVAFIEDDSLRASFTQVFYHRKREDPELQRIMFKSLPTGLSSLQFVCGLGLLAAARCLIQRGAFLTHADNQGWTPLISATSYKRLEIIDLLLRNNRNSGDATSDLADVTGIEQPDNQGWTPLFWAVLKGQAEAAEKLLAAGASTKHKDENRWTVIDWAVFRGDRALVKLLLGHISLEAPDSRTSFGGFSPIFIAAAADDMEMVDMLIQKGMNVHEDTGVHDGTDGAVRRYAGVLSKQERWYRSYGSIRIPSVMQSPRFTIRLLDAAIRSGHLSIVKLLVENGAQLGPVEGELINRTPLHIAAHCDNAEVAKYLLSSGADEAAKDDHGDTALDVAVKAAAVSCTWVLLRPSTASIHKKSTLEYFLVFFVSKTKEKYRWGPDGSIELQFQNSTQHMLEVGPGAPSTRNDVHTVCSEINGHGAPLLDTVQYLLDHGWDVDSKEGIAPLNRANTALSSACRWGMVDLIDSLLRNGANPNAGEHPAIHEACGSDESPIHVVENLIRHGADINKRDYWDEMPLHYACQSLLLDKVKYLIHHGAKVDVYNQAHQHPLHIICGTSSNRENAAELLEFLLPLSDPGVLSADNVTPLMLAIECSRWKAAKLLTQQARATVPKVTAMSKSLWRCARSGDVEGL